MLKQRQAAREQMNLSQTKTLARKKTTTVYGQAEKPFGKTSSESTFKPRASTKSITVTKSTSKKPAPAKKKLTAKPVQKKKKPAPARGADPQDGRIECKSCNRWFNDDRIEKHEDICLSSNQKRAVFKSNQQRIVDPDQEMPMTSRKKKKAAAPKQKQNKWKSQSSAFRNAIRSARTGKAMPQEAVVDDRVECQTCHRKFAEESFARHEGFCKKKAAEQAMRQPPKKVDKKKAMMAQYGRVKK